ncbi:MAG: class I SAM-dependent methyltransferase [Candidatus Latescibacteria bacterium]|jgi:SAM-dependent methyltransferase|nr:class I SAM-dependent methyltransferase [Candidatus Latescibacterota bacterium]
MPAWYEDDAFWETFYPAMFRRRRWEVAPEEVEAALGLLAIEPGAEVLDFCCGPGRHSLELARRGYRVTGVDRTASYLEFGRRQAEAQGLQVEFEQDDIREFAREQSFDAAFSLYTSFGYFENPADDQRVLLNVHRALRPGGKLIMDLSGKEVLARHFQERNWSELDDGSLFLEERTLEDGWERIQNRWMILREGDRHEKRFSVRIYSGVELQALMMTVGFDSVRIYGTLDGGPYDQTARRLVAVACRPHA